jgi:hypothetical protein
MWLGKKRHYWSKSAPLNSVNCSQIAGLRQILLIPVVALLGFQMRSQYACENTRVTATTVAAHGTFLTCRSNLSSYVPSHFADRTQLLELEIEALSSSISSRSSVRMLK